jgi:hypothetical protein
VELLYCLEENFISKYRKILLKQVHPDSCYIIPSVDIIVGNYKIAKKHISISIKFMTVGARMYAHSPKFE